MKERQPKKLNKQKRIAIPLPEGMVDPEAVKKALANFAEAVRENKMRPREEINIPSDLIFDQKLVAS